LYLLRHVVIFLFFFFSSRRRHTRSKRDWSSDVCSSDLGGGERGLRVFGRGAVSLHRGLERRHVRAELVVLLAGDQLLLQEGAVQIGRASCRERVEVWVGAAVVKEKRSMTREGEVAVRN